MGNFWNNNYIEYENNGDRNKNLSVKEYINEVKLYLRDIIIDLQKSDTWMRLSRNFLNHLSRYQIGLETLMSQSKFQTRWIIYIDSPDWIKNKKTRLNPIDKWFQYAVRVA